MTAPKKKTSLLPLLVVLFIISYGLMTMLIIEQGATIQSQSNLINVLMPESHELWGIKSRAIANRAKGQPQSPAQAPPAQATPQSRAEAGKTVKPQGQFPPIPASELDPRRAVRTI